ncbi:MAG: extracellular solute-binding protein [Chloroflexi bacterium]|nr:extracellular solute-binding protein [Chloroflexota bacterium]
MKPATFFCALIIAITFLVACGPPTSETKSPGETRVPAITIAPKQSAPSARNAKGGIRKSASGYKGVLNFWLLGATPSNARESSFGNAVAQFMADNPEIQVELNSYPPTDEGITKLTIALQNGQGIEVLRLASDRLPLYVRDDLIEPIDPYLTISDKADILPNVLDVTRLKDGKAWAWPLWVVPMGIYVNKDVFAEAQVPLPPKDWTWDQFVDAAKKTTFKRANGEPVYGFSGFIDPGVNTTWGLWMNEDPSVRAIGKDGKFGFNNPKAFAGLQRFADLALVHKVTPPDFGAQRDTDIKRGFQSKQYAMIVDATGFAPTLVASKVNFEIYPHPTVNGNKLTVGAVGLIAVAKIKDDAKRQAAMDLARYLTSSQVQEDVPPSSNLPTGFYFAPGARKSVKVVDPLDKFIPMLPDLWITPLMADWGKLTRLFHAEYQNIIFGKAKPAEAIQRIAPEADLLISSR